MLVGGRVERPEGDGLRHAVGAPADGDLHIGAEPGRDPCESRGTHPPHRRGQAANAAFPGGLVGEPVWRKEPGQERPGQRLGGSLARDPRPGIGDRPESGADVDARFARTYYNNNKNKKRQPKK